MKIWSGRWKVEGRRWKVEGGGLSGRWSVEPGSAEWMVEWKVEHGRWKWKVDGRNSTVHLPLSTFHAPLPAVYMV